MSKHNKKPRHPAFCLFVVVFIFKKKHLKVLDITVVPTKSGSDVIFCLQIIVK